MAFLRELASSLAIGMRSALARPRHTLLIALGYLIAGITLAVLLTLPAGLQRLAGATGARDVAVVLPGNTVSESGGSFSTGVAALVGSLPGVAHDRANDPLVAPQFVIATRMHRRDGSTATVLVRGVTPIFWDVAGDAVSLQSGRRFAAGKDELIAGIAAARGFVALDTGATTSIHQNPWHVIGEFAAGGGFWESELWTDLSALQAAYHAQGTLTCLWVKLASPTAFESFSKALHDNPQTRGLRTVTQRDYYATQASFLQWFITLATMGIAVALGLGATLAVVNALGMALDARRRELAILRAVGFRRSTLAVALFIEVLAIGAVCAALAVLVAWLGVNGHEVGSSANGSAIQFRLHVDAHVAGWTIAYLLLIGCASATWPIIRALWSPLVRALHGD